MHGWKWLKKTTTTNFSNFSGAVAIEQRLFFFQGRSFLGRR
jgi:hypothetical protein